MKRIGLIAALMAALASMFAGCSTTALLSLLTPGGGAVTRAVAYGPQLRQMLDVYRPANALSSKPVVVFFYGGAWNRGERADYEFVGKALAARGVLAIVADYRLHPQVSYPDFLSDCALAVTWAQREAAALGADPSNLFIMGHSAGAYNAAMLALDKGRLATPPAGWIGLAGPYDFLPIREPDVQPVFHHPNYPPNSQPIALARRDAPRTLIVVGGGDQRVNPKRNSESLAKNLQAAGADAQLTVYDGVGHEALIAAFAWPLRWYAPVLDRVMSFIAP